MYMRKNRDGDDESEIFKKIGKWNVRILSSATNPGDLST